MNKRKRTNNILQNT